MKCTSILHASCVSLASLLALLVRLVSLPLRQQVGGRFAHLTTLLLRDGSLGAVGVAAVCQGLAAAVPSPPLVELDLSGNEV